ncbi:MAG: hypothetical protein AAF517_21390 [Planctomycetota bacterium]
MRRGSRSEEFVGSVLVGAMLGPLMFSGFYLLAVYVGIPGFGDGRRVWLGFPFFFLRPFADRELAVALETIYWAEYGLILGPILVLAARFWIRTRNAGLNVR